MAFATFNVAKDPELRDLLTAAPFRERVCGLLMTALARAG
ncbi:BTAD domain-containing putative transcriptional regulator, partial [Amycolatopsis japonica]